MGDFAILLRSGFDRWQATKAQIITGLGGILGAIVALFYSNSIHSMSTVSFIVFKILFFFV
jgi:zinc transporter 13